MCRKVLGMKGRCILFFRRNILVSQSRKSSWAILQCFRKIGVSNIFMHNRGYNVFRSKIFGLTVPKNFEGIPSRFQKNWGIEKFYAYLGVSQFSVEDFLSNSAEKFRQGNLLFLRKFLFSKIFMDEKGGITFFRQKKLVSQCQNFSWASLQCIGKIGVSKSFVHIRGYDVFPSKIFGLTVPRSFVGIPSRFEKS